MSIPRFGYVYNSEPDILPLAVPEATSRILPPNPFSRLPNELLYNIARHIPDLKSYHSFTQAERRISNITRSAYARKLFVKQLSPPPFTVIVDHFLHSKVYEDIFGRPQLWARWFSEKSVQVPGLEAGHFVLRVYSTIGAIHIPIRLVGEFPIALGWFERVDQLRARSLHRTVTSNIGVSDISTELYTPKQYEDARTELIWDLMRWCWAGHSPWQKDAISEFRFKDEKSWMAVSVEYDYLPQENSNASLSEREAIAKTSWEPAY
ncbi:hypothetical protein BJ508DRAFT_344720 [Ascobolus immersus RN42]|uniref:F-box domain-containing protein n=1 Tax=Ascobolus immersus RN42 TaxID=1160509 RepID=A0A3N4I7Y4_ASCIM|nr:hypothetical protein BJ508DRAFT_344720 [Ascobolus immersus RN42]